MSEQVTFKLNEKDVTVPKGWTVMQAAKRENVSIPHFCWHPKLSVAGVCRFCMVHVEGARKLEIACNLEARDGMVVRTDRDEVKEAHKWALEFHLINHPLDCPVCDQAGECGLQDFYMDVGKYESQMSRPKVLKPKAIDLGRELVLDTERCILCSRCVRFEEEVTKTNALGIFDRGDRAIIGTYGDEKIEHNYQENLVDICPVGAFTSKKFRFKQRVWFLKEKSSVCPGCSTGCHIKVHGKPDIRRLFRIKPEECDEVNGAWMCDQGRTMHQHLNPEYRLNEAMVLDPEAGQSFPGTHGALATLLDKISRTQVDSIALLVSAQYTNEEYVSLFDFFIKGLGVSKVYLWRTETEQTDDFDGILLRGDRNPNTTGLMQILRDYPDVGAKTVMNELSQCIESRPEVLITLCPEIPSGFPDLKNQLQDLSSLPWVSVWGVHHDLLSWEFSHLLPMKGFIEKNGTFINHAGKEGHLTESFAPMVSEALSVSEVIEGLKRIDANGPDGQKGVTDGNH